MKWLSVYERDENLKAFDKCFVCRPGENLGHVLFKTPWKFRPNHWSKTERAYWYIVLLRNGWITIAPSYQVEELNEHIRKSETFLLNEHGLKNVNDKKQKRYWLDLVRGLAEAKEFIDPDYFSLFRKDDI